MKIKKINFEKNIEILSDKDVYFIFISNSNNIEDNIKSTIFSIEDNQIVKRYGKLNINSLIKAIPSLIEMNLNQNNDFGEWRHEYIETGNHLLIKENVYLQFMQFRGLVYTEFDKPVQNNIKKILLHKKPSFVKHDCTQLYINYEKYAVRILNKILDEKSKFGLNN